MHNSAYCRCTTAHLLQDSLTTILTCDPYRAGAGKLASVSVGGGGGGGGGSGGAAAGGGGGGAAEAEEEKKDEEEEEEDDVSVICSTQVSPSHGHLELSVNVVISSTYVNVDQASTLASAAIMPA